MTDVSDPAPCQPHRLRFPGTLESDSLRGDETAGADARGIAERLIDAAGEALHRAGRAGRAAAGPAARRAA